MSIISNENKQQQYKINLINSKNCLNHRTQEKRHPYQPKIYQPNDIKPFPKVTGNDIRQLPPLTIMERKINAQWRKITEPGPRD